MTKEEQRVSAQSLIRDLAPIITALLGSSGVIVLARSDVPERFRVGAEALFWISLCALIFSIVAAVYPIVGEPQIRWSIGRVHSALNASKEQRGFDEWMKHWRAYSALLTEALQDKTQANWQSSQRRYAALRGWLIANQQRLPADVAIHTRQELATRWDQLTKLEARLGLGTGLYPLLRHTSFDTQMIVMLSESKEPDVFDKGQRWPLSRTIEGVWEALSDYSVKRGWGVRHLDADGLIGSPDLSL